MNVLNILDEIKIFQSHGRIGKYFTVKDVKSVTNNPEADNLSNYALDNGGSSNKNTKVLNRRKDTDGVYEYFF